MQRLALFGILLWLLYSGAAFTGDASGCGDGQATVRPNGDPVCLQGVATVAFPAGAFPAPTAVTLRTSADQDVGELFTDTTAMFLATGRLDYELRIGTGSVRPNAAGVQVTMAVPEELQLFTLTGHALEVFAAIERRNAAETPDLMFELQESRFDPAARTISFQLPGTAFADNQYTQGEFQAIVTLAPTPSGDCH